MIILRDGGRNKYSSYITPSISNYMFFSQIGLSQIMPHYSFYNNNRSVLLIFLLCLLPSINLSFF